MSLWLPAGAEPDAEAGRDRPTLFLDRDGVLIEDRGYVHDPGEVALLPGVPEALARARAAGLRLVGLSNQSGIGRGLYGESDFAAVQARVDELLAAGGVRLDALFYCPHAPGDGCRCRKPAPGLLEEAARLFAWPRRGSWLVGDKLGDVDLALAAGLAAVLVRTGQGETAAARLDGRAGVLVVADLPAAVAAILADAP